ncbi:hypothetical protein GCM10023114_33530 [Mycolicibacterium sediminis]|uniref:Uncharacterized protein n=1 Tax=Mycolicibacterium sediminis TaxID=1286180 RepID=A0A7I7QZ02_9MYCO|nr:hypothetical protein MSEDJ_56900 [Mycolicibacterium sediminis]
MPHKSVTISGTANADCVDNTASGQRPANRYSPASTNEVSHTHDGGLYWPGKVLTDNTTPVIAAIHQRFAAEKRALIDRLSLTRTHLRETGRSPLREDEDPRSGHSSPAWALVELRCSAPRVSV